jgi:hypothetical protein
MAGAARISRETLFKKLDRGFLRREFSPREEHDNRADDRQEKAGRMKKRAVLGLREYAGNQPTHNGTANADDRSHPKPKMSDRHKPLGDHPNNEPNDNGPDNM